MARAGPRGTSSNRPWSSLHPTSSSSSSHQNNSVQAKNKKLSLFVVDRELEMGGKACVVVVRGPTPVKYGNLVGRAPSTPRNHHRRSLRPLSLSLCLVDDSVENLNPNTRKMAASPLTPRRCRGEKGIEEAWVQMKMDGWHRQEEGIGEEKGGMGWMEGEASMKFLE